MMTVGEARRLGRVNLEGSVQNSALDADILLGHVLEWPRSRLIAEDREALSPESRAQFLKLLERRAAGEPVAYLTGKKQWFGMVLDVDRSVLVPRPETELLAEAAIDVCYSVEAHLCVDVGTGSGAVAIAIAGALPGLRMIGIDISREALAVAQRNAVRILGEGRVELLPGDLLATLKVEPDVVVANLPYITSDERSELGQDVLSEPAEALFAGPTGLEPYRRLFAQMVARQWRPEVLLEVDPRRAEGVASVATDAFPDAGLEIIPDLAGKDRIIRMSTLHHRPL